MRVRSTSNLSGTRGTWRRCVFCKVHQHNTPYLAAHRFRLRFPDPITAGVFRAEITSFLFTAPEVNTRTTWELNTFSVRFYQSTAECGFASCKGMTCISRFLCTRLNRLYSRRGCSITAINLLLGFCDIWYPLVFCSCFKTLYASWKRKP